MNNSSNKKIINWQVGPRDGLQFYKFTVDIQSRLEFIKKLYNAGERRIEAGSFVRADIVPCMEETDTLAKKIRKNIEDGEFKEAIFSFLTLNKSGAEIASQIIDPKWGEIAVVVAASDDFSRRNMKVDNREEAFEKLVKPVLEVASKKNFKVRGYISTIFVEPRDNNIRISPVLVADMTKRLLDMGIYEVSLGDTTGSGNVEMTANLINELKNAGISLEKIALHLHNTYGRAIENIKYAIGEGIRIFDSSAGGLGGCVFAGSPVGNVATEDLIVACRDVGFDTGLNLEEIAKSAYFIHTKLGKVPACSITNSIIKKELLPEIKQLIPDPLVKSNSELSTPHINVSIDDRGVTYVSLNRKDKSNSFDETLIKDIKDLFTLLSEDIRVKVVVLCGEGENFSAGADLNWMRKMAEFSFEENFDDAKKLSAMFESIYVCKKPVICRVHGAVMGGGNGLVAAADYVVAGLGAQFSFSEVHLGLRPSTISVYCVPRLGKSNSIKLFCSGIKFSSYRAIEYGLVDEIAPMDKLDECVEKIVVHALASGKDGIRKKSELSKKANFIESKNDLPTEPKKIVDLIELVIEYLDKNNRNELLNKLAADIADARSSIEAKKKISEFLSKSK